MKSIFHVVGVHATIFYLESILGKNWKEIVANNGLKLFTKNHPDMVVIGIE